MDKFFVKINSILQSPLLKNCATISVIMPGLNDIKDSFVVALNPTLPCYKRGIAIFRGISGAGALATAIIAPRMQNTAIGRTLSLSCTYMSNLYCGTGGDIKVALTCMFVVRPVKTN